MSDWVILTGGVAIAALFWVTGFWPLAIVGSLIILLGAVGILTRERAE
jgi:hypothetical protein